MRAPFIYQWIRDGYLVEHPGNQIDFEFMQKSRDGHPEVIARQQDTLYVPAVALTQCIDQLSVHGIGVMV